MSPTQPTPNPTTAEPNSSGAPSHAGHRFLDASSALGLALIIIPAWLGSWRLNAFCWSTWFGGLCLAFLCLLVGFIRVVLEHRNLAAFVNKTWPQLTGLPPWSLWMVNALAASVAAWGLYKAYGLAFGFFGAFLSFFAEMEPHHLFGRNGFINARTEDLLYWLFREYWSVAVAVAIGARRIWRLPTGWSVFVAPLGSELLRLHLFVVLMPPLTLLVWAVVGDGYDFWVITLLSLLMMKLPTEPTPPAQGLSS